MNKRRPMQRGSHDNKNRGQGHKFDTVDETPNLVGFPHASPNDILNDKDHDYYLRNDNLHEKDNVDDEHIDDVYINDALAQVKDLKVNGIKLNTFGKILPRQQETVLIAQHEHRRIMHGKRI